MHACSVRLRCVCASAVCVCVCARYLAYGCRHERVRQPWRKAAAREGRKDKDRRAAYVHADVWRKGKRRTRWKVRVGHMCGWRGRKVKRDKYDRVVCGFEGKGSERGRKGRRRTVTSSPPLDQTRSSEAAQCGIGVFRCRGGSAMVARGDWKSGGRAS